ncbi:MAG: iron-containing alcohol dehydrogenase family protein [Anaerolineae bacterium]
MSPAIRYYLPTEIVTGVGSFDQLGKLALRLGRRALLVGSRGRLALLQQAVDLLMQAGGEALVFDGVAGEPTLEAVEAVRAQARAFSAEVLIGIGGGSAIDTAKAAAGLHRQPGSVAEYQQGRRLDSGRGLPLIAVPTTAGSGAEVTRNAVLLDTVRGIKESIRDDAWFPTVALVDPALTLTLPPAATATTGADALCQAIEAYTSTGSGPLSDALATDAIPRIGQSLQRAVANGGDLQARSDMLYGSLQAGIAMVNARLGAVHGLAHPLGARYGIAHGLLCGLLLPVVMAYNRSHAAAKYARVANLVGLDTTGLTTEQAADAAIAWVRDLMARIGIPAHASSLGVRAEDFDALTSEALQQSSLGFNPRPLQAADVQALLQQAL